MNYRLICLIILLIAALATLFFYKPEFNTSHELPGYYDLMLTDEQLADLEKKSASGDSQAGYHIYEYYNFVKMDSINAMKWLTISANQGNAAAQYALGYEYEYTLHDPKLALIWYKKAAQKNHKYAQEAIIEIQKKSVSSY